MTLAPPLVLFDVDLTLLTAKGAGARSLLAALADLTGVRIAVETVKFEGATDYAIHGWLCEEAGVLDLTEEFRARLVENYLGRLVAEVAARPPVAMPGVAGTLERLLAAGATLGLATGNLERGARIKLDPLGLNRFFSAGGFGDRHADRTDVVLAAIEACSARHGVPFAPSGTVVVGDTPRDIDAGRRAGARTVGVATGNHTRAALAGADLVLTDLAEATRLAEFILGPRATSKG
ncbi:MAG: HAD family hydrolase [Planctomycetes bacterium]|nr:HAD family hydrolase [Planctomycetota bacterium]